MDLKKGKHKDPVYLTTDEIEKIIKYDPRDSGIEKMIAVQDLFVFQCYTGVALICKSLFINYLQPLSKRIGNDLETIGAHYSASVFNI